MLIRINSSAGRWAKHPELSIRVGFAVPLNEPQPGALPSATENLVLNQMEDKILNCLDSHGPAIHVLTITTGTFKEFVYYVKDGNSIAGAHEQIKAEVTSHDVQCVAEHDPQWEVYKEFSQ